MKKWLVVILVSIATIGTFFPCCLVDNCNNEETANKQNENPSIPEGTCSPFFACATCPGFVQLSKPVQVVQPQVGSLIHQEENVTFNLTKYPSSFWQPPRLS